MTQITVPNVATEVEYSVVSSSTGPFTVPFPFFDDDDVQCLVTTAAGAVTVLVVTTDFTWTTQDAPVGQEGNGYEGGTITLNVAIGADGDTTLKIFRSTVIDRTSNYPNTGPFSVPLLNDEQNKFVMMMQEMTQDKGDIGDGVTLKISDSAGTAFVEHYVTTDGDNYVLDFTNIGDLGSNGGILMQATGNQPNRLVINDFGTMFFNSKRNGQSGLVLGETTTLRGDSQNSAVTLYAEDSGAITFGQLACRGERLWLNAQGMYLQFDGTGAAEFNVDSFKLSEVAAAPADEAAYGQIWVKDDAPNVLMFTDDAGTDFLLSDERTILKAGGETRVTTTTLENDDDFIGISLDNASWYEVKVFLKLGAGSGVDPDFKWQFVFSQPLQVANFGLIRHTDSTPTEVVTQNTDFIAENSVEVDASELVYLELTQSILTNASTDSTFNLQWAQNTSSSSILSMYAGSYISVKKLS